MMSRVLTVRQNIRRALLLVYISFAVVACGGSGGGGDGTTPQSTSNNWDEMQWGQGQWQ